MEVFRCRKREEPGYANPPRSKGRSVLSDGSMPPPRVLVALDGAEAWSRGILLGFAAAAHERSWELLHYDPSADVDWLTNEWGPSAAVVGPRTPPGMMARLSTIPVVSVNADRSDEGVPSVCPDEERIAVLALRHLLSRGGRNVSTFRFSSERFAVVRERAFLREAERARAKIARGWWQENALPPRTLENRPALLHWLRSLPKPCGIFACCDRWARVVARYARAAALRIPEDISLVGVDNDIVECELITPSLSSVAVPWRTLGQEAARLLWLMLARQRFRQKRVIVGPVDVVARRSSDTLAIADELVARAVAWIREHVRERVNVPLVARAVGSSRKRLERRFRAVLARTVQEEVRRVRVELAKKLLCETNDSLARVANESGFSSAALLSVAFQRELGVPPGAYRRRMAVVAGEADH